MNLIECQTFTVQPFEVDYKGNIAFPLLVNNLLNVASHHANKRGFGVAKLNQGNRTWVLSRIAIELYAPPRIADSFQIETWIESVMRTFTFRNFAIKKLDGKPIGYARTIWAMIDQSSRRPINLTGMGIEKFICNRDCPIEKISKISDASTSIADEFVVKYSDIDLNRHLNSAKYIEHILNSLSKKELIENDIRRMEVEYIEECVFSDRISVTKSNTDIKETTISLIKESGKTVCRSRLTFK